MKKPVAESWKLEDSIAQETQAIVTTGFGRLEHGQSLFIELPDNCGGRWLDDINSKIPITAASSVGGNPPLEYAASVAFTWTGLKKMGLPETALASFSSPFKQGMFQEDRLRRLGDKRKGEWLDTTGKVEPRWSGNTPSQRTKEKVDAYSVETVEEEQEDDVATTGISVHAIVLIYAVDVASANRLVTKVKKTLKPHGAKVVHSLPVSLKVEDDKFGREHFGFADGISQPIPFDETGAVKKRGEDVNTPDGVNGAALGEFLIGYNNGHQEIAPGPVAPGELSNGKTDKRIGKAELPQHRQARGFYDIGLNGSYLVVRELNQNVSAFWKSMEQGSKHIRDQDPKAGHVTAEWLAEKIVGRSLNGCALRPDGPLKPKQGEMPANDFLYYEEDQFGLGCPLGSHVRRANPRDSLTPFLSARSTLLNAANNHRILRRGRKYGPKQADRLKDDGKERGLLFMCLNTDIARQFEFTQQTWLLNKDFSTLYEEVDPLVGADGWMTVPEEPLRRRIQVQTFVELKGGEYFFLPSLPTIKYLALL